MKDKKNKYRVEFSRGQTTKQTTKNNRPWIDNMEERFDRCLQIFGCNFCRPVLLGSEKSLRMFHARETIMLGILFEFLHQQKKSDNPSKTTQMAISFSKEK